MSLRARIAPAVTIAAFAIAMAPARAAAGPAPAPEGPRGPRTDGVAVTRHLARAGDRLQRLVPDTVLATQLSKAAAVYLARGREAARAGSFATADQYAAAADELVTAVEGRPPPPPPPARPHLGEPDPRPPDPRERFAAKLDRVSTTLATVANVSSPDDLGRSLASLATGRLTAARHEDAIGDLAAARRDARCAESIARATLHVAFAEDPTGAPPGPPEPGGPGRHHPPPTGRRP